MRKGWIMARCRCSSFVLVWIVALLVFSFAVRAQNLDLTGYQTTFLEDFDNLSISNHGPMNGARWNARTPWNGDFGSAAFRDPSTGFPFTVNNGVLRIEMRYNVGLNKWESGLLSSIGTDGQGFAQKFGYFEMRAKFPAGHAVWPAFWLFTKTRVTHPNDLSIMNVEIDVVEYYGQRPDRYSATIHRWDRDLSDGNQSTHSHAYVFRDDMTDDFHTYGLLIEDDFITFYYDGVEVRKSPTPPEAKAPLFILLDLALDNSAAPFDDTPSPSYMYVDYVKAMSKPSTNVVADNANLTGVTQTGDWMSSFSVAGFYGINYAHDNNTGKGNKSVRFTPDLPAAGEYEVSARWTSDPNRANNVPIVITSALGVETVTVDQRINGGEWVSLGTYTFNAGTAGHVVISNTNTTGYVVADAVKFEPVAGGGVTIIENQGNGSAWPDVNPTIDVAGGNTPGFFNVAVAVPLNGSVSQTFTPLQTFVLDKIDVAYTSNGGGPVGVRLQEANVSLNANGTAYQYAVGPNLFPTTDLTFTPTTATSGIRVITLDFTGNDQITLQAGKTYAIEFYDPGGPIPSFVLGRRGSSTYGSGMLFVNRSSVNGTHTRDAGMQLFGD